MAHAAHNRQPLHPWHIPIHGEAGFTVVEVLIALQLTVITAISVASLANVAMTTVHRERVQTALTALAIEKLEQLRALAFTSNGPGLRVTDSSTDLTQSAPAPGGYGLAPSPPDSLAHDTAGFVDFLDANGRWVGTSPTAPSVAFVRRWAIRPLLSHAEDALALRVAVAPFSHLVAVPSHALVLTTIKARRVQ